MGDRYRFFGEVALKREFVSASQLAEALIEQAAEREAGGEVKLLGQMLLEKGYITAEQIQNVLDELYPIEADVEIGAV